MKFLFLMDPLETVAMEKDTTFILMVGAHARGHDVYFLAEDGIALKDGKVHFHVVKVKPQLIVHEPFIEEHAATLTQDQVHAVFVRPDPPVDEQYLMNTWLLDQLPPNVLVINKPSGIRTVNEKIWAAQFTDITPKTLISCRRPDLLDFIAKEKSAKGGSASGGNGVIAKPTNAFGGHAVFHIKPGDTNTKVILENLSRRWSVPVVLQRYVPDAESGDKRILLLNGEPLGAVLRVHEEGDHRNNFFAGGKPHAAQLTARDSHIIGVLKEHLLRLGLYFVGIDIIGGFLIEVNVTSPTCMQEMNRLYNVALQEKVIDFVEKSVK